MLPVAEAADRTYTKVLLAVPFVCASVTLLPYPLPAASDTSKPDGAVAVILADKMLPETVNCWIFGLADGEPAQAEMVPVTEPGFIIGIIDVGLTVIEKVTGGLLQPGPDEIKLPNEVG